MLHSVFTSCSHRKVKLFIRLYYYTVYSYGYDRRMSNFHLGMKGTGKVKFFDSVKGFGFITPDQAGDDLFVHQTSILAQGFRSLAEGEPVEFDVSEDKSKGKTFATNVTGPNGVPVQGAPRRERDDSTRY